MIARRVFVAVLTGLLAAGCGTAPTVATAMRPARVPVAATAAPLPKVTPVQARSECAALRAIPRGFDTYYGQAWQVADRYGVGVLVAERIIWRDITGHCPRLASVVPASAAEGHG